MEGIKNQITSPAIFKFSHSYPISVELQTDFSKNDLLSINSTVFIKDVWPSSNQIKVSARAIFNLLYKEDNNINHYESGADLSYDITNEKIASDNVIDIRIKISDAEMRKTQSGQNELTATVITTVYLCQNQTFSFVENIEDAVVKKHNQEVLEFISSSSTSFSVDGEKDFPYFIEKVLCHQSDLKITSKTALLGEVVVEGEITTQFLICKNSGEKTFQTMVAPFRYEIERSDSTPLSKILVFGDVANALFKISSQEGENGSVVTGEYLVNLRVSLFNSEQKNFAVDGFSTKYELEFDCDNFSYLTTLENTSYNHKVFGEGDVAFEEAQNVVSVISCNATLSDYEKIDSAIEISGILSCEILCTGAENEILIKVVRLPFTCSFKCDKEPVYINVYTKNPVVRNLDGKCIMECELTFDASLESRNSQTFITEVNAVKERDEGVSAISVVFINKGDDLWAVCKKAVCEESILLANNPDLTFPATSDKAVVVYHKL